MRMVRLSVLLGLALTMASPTLAQTVVGRAVVEGRTVTLFDDNSWTFDTEAVADTSCQQVDPNVLFCDAGAWRPLPKQQEFDALYSWEGEYYGGLIIEKFGRDQGLNIDLLRTAAITNAAGATGTTPEMIPVIDTFEESTEALEFEGIVYTATISGTPFIFANAMFVKDTFSGQAMVWTFGTEFTDAHRDMVSEFINRVALKETPQ